MKKINYILVLVLLFMLVGCGNQNTPNTSEISSTSQAISYNGKNDTEVLFISSMGCFDKDCTALNHYHDCQSSCLISDHYHNCSQGCSKSEHHHSEQTDSSKHSEHHSDSHH